MSTKNVFATLGAIAVGSLVAGSVALQPVFADTHGNTAPAGDHGKKEGDKACSGKKEGDKACSGEKKADKACSGEHGCSGKTEEGDE